MSMKVIFLAAGLCVGATAGSQAQTLNGLPCNEFCQNWMNSNSLGTYDGSPSNETPALNVRARPGRATMVNDYYSLNPDCGSRGPVQVQMTAMPSHGEVSVDESRMKPRFSRDDGMSVCNSRRVPVTRVFYQPEPGFSEDSFTLSLTFPNGETTQETYRVTAR